MRSSWKQRRFQQNYSTMSEGKVYFITGGNRGIGYELVKQLAQVSSNTVIASTRDVSRSKELKDLSESNKNVKIVTLDVSDEASINKLDAQLAEVAPDGIDVFISNAGIAETTIYNPVLEVGKDVWLKHYTTNVLGPILTTQKVFPYLEKKDTKQIIWISSISGSIGENFIPISISAYGQSKAALNFTFRSLSLELGPKGYTAVAVHPGVVKTDLGKASFTPLLEKFPGVFDEALAGAIEPSESARLQIELFNKLTKEDNGKFLSYDGTALPW